MTTVEMNDSDKRTGAVAAYALFLLSIPSLAIFAPVGAVVAWLGRDGAQGLVREHFEAQLRLFFTTVVLSLGLFALSIPAWALTVVLIGFPILLLLALAGFALMVWFTLKSLFGLLRLLDGRPPAP